MDNKTLQKNSLLKYFEIFKSKFFKIIILNLIFFTALTIIVSIIFALSYIIFSSPTITKLSYIFVPLACLPLIALGPFIGAIIKMCRDYVREVPGFFNEDFKLALKSNWKQCTSIALFQYIIIWLFCYSIPFYYQNSAENNLNMIMLGICFFALIIFIFMNFYLYMMAVTLKLKFIEIIKNSLIFSFLCIFKNILLLIILIIWVALTGSFVYFAVTSANGLIYGLAISFLMLLFFGFIFYSVSFFTFPSIKKYILDPYYEKHPEESSASLKNIKSDNNDDTGETTNENELSDLVYYNGKMIYRSALEQEQIFNDKQTFNNNDKKQ